MKRRSFLRKYLIFLPMGGFIGAFFNSVFAKVLSKSVSVEQTRYGMGIQIEKCIGCGRCVQACKIENDVPKEPYYYRTWVERYIIKRDGDVLVQSKEGGALDVPSSVEERDILRSFFVPKLCNHCKNPPCAQVCPVGATFQTREGIVLVDANRCIGCSYCLQACPYGARYMHPERHTADKCTLCYHRVTKGYQPVCVEVCPTQARVFGKLNGSASPLTRLKQMNNTHVLKSSLNTEPRVFYTNLDGEVM